MASKHDLINMAIKQGNVVAILNLCIKNKEFTEICEKEEKIQKKISKFFSDLTNDDRQLIDVTNHLIYKHQITDEKKIKNIISLIKSIIDKKSTETDTLYQLIKLLRTLETRKQGGWIYINYKPEQEKLFSISGPDSALKISTNDEMLLKMMFKNYFKTNSKFDTQQIYQM